MSRILLSFCIPTYNRPESVLRILRQITSFKSEEIEIVISDDNPSNIKTKELVKTVKDSRIRFFKNKKNLGFDTNILMTFKRAKGEFVFLIMDDDDVEIDSIPWLLKVITENKNLSQICGNIGDNRSDQTNLYFQYEFGEKLIKRGSESLEKLLFYIPHGSGIVLNKNKLDLNQAANYIGCLYIQQALIAQALVSGNSLCSTKTFANIGKIEYKSDQKLFKNKDYEHPIYRLLQYKFKIQIIYDITKGEKRLRNSLLYYHQNYIYIFFSNLFISRNIIEILQNLISGFKIILSMRIIIRGKFWIFVLKQFFQDVFNFRVIINKYKQYNK